MPPSRIRPYIRGRDLHQVWTTVKASRFWWHHRAEEQLSLGVYAQPASPMEPVPPCHGNCELNEQLRTRIKLAANFAQLHYDLWRMQRPMEYEWSWHEWLQHFRNEVSWQAADRPHGMIAEEAPWSRTSKWLFAVTTTIYGFVHVSAFRHQFPSTAEKVLWMFASGIIVLSALYNVYHFSRPRTKAEKREYLTTSGGCETQRELLSSNTGDNKHNNQWSGPVPPVWRRRELKIVLPLSLVFVARLFVLLEALISLRSMRGDVYKSTSLDVLPKFQ